MPTLVTLAESYSRFREPQLLFLPPKTPDFNLYPVDCEGVFRLSSMVSGKRGKLIKSDPLVR